LRERGASTIEMTLVGIPLIFTLISIFEISRGMWMYHTMAYAVREAARYAMVHGQNCVNAPPTVQNDCWVQLGATRTVGGVSFKGVAEVLRDASVGVIPAEATVTFTAGASTTCVLSSCVSSTSQWPPSGGNGKNDQISITMVAPFRSALAMFWPGAAAVKFGVANFSAVATERIQF
jgi:Flp pilus assembly protein TadG